MTNKIRSTKTAHEILKYQNAIKPKKSIKSFHADIETKLKKFFFFLEVDG